MGSKDLNPGGNCNSEKVLDPTDPRPEDFALTNVAPNSVAEKKNVPGDNPGSRPKTGSQAATKQLVSKHESPMSRQFERNVVSVKSIFTRSPDAHTSRSKLKRSDVSQKQLDNKDADFMKDHEKLRELYNSLLNQHHKAERQLRALQVDLDTQRSRSIREQEEAVRLQQDNALLRSQIIDMSNAQEPIKDEAYYIREFQGITGEIESWAIKDTSTMNKGIASLVKKQPSPRELTLSELASGLRNYGQHGQKAAVWLKGLDKGQFQERRYRIALIRHVVSLVLLDVILSRYIFGMERDRSEDFREIEESIYQNGMFSPQTHKFILGNYPLSKVLTVRQAIGRATLGLVSNETAVSARDAIIRALKGILELLSSKPDSSKIEKFVTKVVDKTVALRTMMAQEQAIYQCYFVDSGESFDGGWVGLDYGDEPKSKVVMCTFPGLRRFTVRDGKREFIAVVKATAMLASG